MEAERPPRLRKPSSILRPPTPGGTKLVESTLHRRSLQKRAGLIPVNELPIRTISTIQEDLRPNFQTDGRPKAGHPSPSSGVYSQGGIHGLDSLQVGPCVLHRRITQVIKGSMQLYVMDLPADAPKKFPHLFPNQVRQRAWSEQRRTPAKLTWHTRVSAQTNPILHRPPGTLKHRGCIACVTAAGHVGLLDNRKKRLRPVRRLPFPQITIQIPTDRGPSFHIHRANNGGRSGMRKIPCPGFHVPIHPAEFSDINPFTVE